MSVVPSTGHNFVSTQYLENQWTEFHRILYVFFQITVHSSDENRCLMSAYCNLAGLFPPGKEQEFEDKILWQPIPVHTRPETEDNVGRIYTVKPRKFEILTCLK